MVSSSAFGPGDPGSNSSTDHANLIFKEMVNVCYYIGLLINIILREKGLWKKGEDRKGLILRQHNN